MVFHTSLSTEMISSHATVTHHFCKGNVSRYQVEITSYNCFFFLYCKCANNIVKLSLMVPKKHSNPRFPCGTYSITPPQYLAMKICCPSKKMVYKIVPTIWTERHVLIFFQLVQDFVHQQDIPIIHFSNISR